MNEDNDRFNGFGTHHDRFVTTPEMVLIGFGLWRGLQWYKDNHQRLTPEQQAQYELETERWKNYLRWENVTPGARQAREQYFWDQEREEREAHHQRGKDLRYWLLWVPASLMLFIGVSANVIPGVGGVKQGAIEGAVGVVAWLIFMKLWAEFSASWKRVQVAKEAAAVAAASEVVVPPVESSPYLPALYKSKPEEGRA